ncbi:MAG: GTP pyrophosphokinase family protein [Coriobacteriales bacterium]|nr:GTP pyrophosphokinase family protein [Coriobacteriales bacterium]
MEPEALHNHDEILALSTIAQVTPEISLDVRELMTLMQEYRAAIREVKTKFEILDEDARTRMLHSPIHQISARLKTPTSLIEKIRRKNIPLTIAGIREQVYDVAGVRVVCHYLSDVEAVAEEFLRQDDVQLVDRRDYIANPKESGYRSLHIIVKVPVFLNDMRRLVNVEVQIRTIAMDFWASLEHRLRYKNQSVLDANKAEIKKIRARLVSCADQIASIDQAMQQIQIEIDKLSGPEANDSLDFDAEEFIRRFSSIRM